MKRSLFGAAALTLAFSNLAPAFAQQEAEASPSPNQIVEMASPGEWVTIPAEDLLVMTLAPDRDGNPREVMIQLMPAPFSQGWVENIRTLARADWYDGITINRVQDNYVVQWGDPNYDNPEAEGEAKPLPDGLRVMREDEYTSPDLRPPDSIADMLLHRATSVTGLIASGLDPAAIAEIIKTRDEETYAQKVQDRYARFASFARGWPIAGNDTGNNQNPRFWPVHCYGMVGVGRDYSPDTGSGAELYTVIGHAPRHLDRNIALVGRIIEDMEHLASLPRGSGALGFYTKEEADKRTPIQSIRVASDLPQGQRPNFEYLSTESETFAKYAEARANRRDPFFIVPASGADICNIPVPVRRVKTE